MTPPNAMVQIQTNQVSFSLRLLENDPTISPLIFANKIWEPHVTRQFEKIITPGMDVLDIGAHFGYYSLLAAKKLNGSGRVYAFEPDETNFKLLLKNIRENQMEGKILPYQCAAGEKNEDCRLYGNLEGDTSDRILFSTGKEKISQVVRCVRVEDYLQEQVPEALNRIRVIKMDIEGFEMFAARGITKLLGRQGIHLFTELNYKRLRDAGTSAKEYLAMLSNFEFKIFQINYHAANESEWLKSLPLSELGKENDNHVDLYCAK